MRASRAAILPVLVGALILAAHAPSSARVRAAEDPAVGSDGAGHSPVLADARFATVRPPRTIVPLERDLGASEKKVRRPGPGALPVGPPPPNDRCIDATPIQNRNCTEPDLFDFDNTTATTDGPQNHLLCNQFGVPFLERDVWYCWTAPCDGTATLETCGLTTVDTKIAVYRDCAAPAPCGQPPCDPQVPPCPCDCPELDARILDCNDDACGTQSRVVWNVVAGQGYLIRIGTFPGEPGGTGQFRITVQGQPPALCSVGCGAPNRQNAFNATHFRTADNFQPSSSGQVTSICFWGIYNSGAPQDRFTVRYYADANGLPGTLLATFTTFDSQTRQQTGARLLGRPEYEYRLTHPPVVVAAGSCYWVQISNAVTGNTWFWEASSARDRKLLQDANNVWDREDYVFTHDLAFCVDVPVETQPGCPLPPPCPLSGCPPGGTLEPESCGQQPPVNDGCATPPPDPPAFGAIACGETICGTLWASGNFRDSDWYIFTLTTTSVVRATLRAELPVTMTLFNSGRVCPVPFGTRQGTPADSWCSAGESVIQLQPGEFLLHLAPGLTSGGLYRFFPCGTENDYQVTLTCCDQIVCPPGAISEAEPCGQDVNGGCDRTPAQFTDLQLDQTVCGQSFANLGLRDTDWYRFTLTTTTSLTATVQPEFPAYLAILPGDCMDPTVLAQAEALPCGGVGRATASDLAPGTYLVFVAPGNLDEGIFDGIPCGLNNDYTLSLTRGACAPAVCPARCAVPEIEGCGPANDLCATTPSVIECGQTVCGLASDADAEDWYRFTLTQAAPVTVVAAAQFDATLEIWETCGLLAGQGDVPACLAGVARTGAALAAGEHYIRLVPTGPAGSCPPEANYVLTLLCRAQRPCPLDCSGIPENEPCGQHVNDGCARTPPVFGSLSPGQTVCGQVWVDCVERDEDWYRFTLSAAADAVWTVQSEGVPLRIEMRTAGCPGSLLGQAEVLACGPVPLSVPRLPGGTYVARVRPADGAGPSWNCVLGEGLNYSATLSTRPPSVCTAIPPCPPPFQEPEPCGAKLNDRPGQAVPIACNTTVCGTSWALLDRFDVDIYEFTLTTTSNVMLRVSTEDVPLRVMPLWSASVQPRLPLSLGRCGTAALSFGQLAPGSYAFSVAFDDSPGGSALPLLPCDLGSNDYRLELVCTPPGGCNGCPTPGRCPGDANGDACVDQLDLGTLLAGWNARRGEPGYDGCADFNCDNVIDQADLGTLLSRFGTCCAGGACPPPPQRCP